MTNINVDKKYLLNEIGIKLSDAEIRDQISMMGTDPEEITGNEIVVEVFPNRPDLLSGYSIARSFKSFLGKSTGLKKYSAKKPEKDFKVIIDKSVSEVRPFTACAIVKNLEFDDLKIKEVIQLQEKLHLTFGRNRKKLAIGIYPLEKIQLPIHYKADRPEKIKFLPLEANREMTGKEILRKHPTGIKYAHLLENAKVYPYFADNDNNILSMPPIINSELTGRIDEKTKDVFIECSGFDYDVLSKCLNIIVTILSDMNGDIYSMNLEYPDSKKLSPNLEPEEMILDLEYVKKILGVDLKPAEAKKCLEKLGHGVLIKDKSLTISVPCYRTDILHKADLVEDIAIGYGYDNFKTEIPQVASIAEENQINKFARRIKQSLMGLNFLEIHSYDIVNAKAQTELINNKEKPVMLLSNVSSEFDSMRTNLAISLLDTLKFNLKNEIAEAIFEIGTVYHHNKKQETNILENEHLGIMLCSKDSNFTSAKQVLTTLMKRLSCEFSLKESDDELFITGRAGDIIIKNKIIGRIGELHPQIIKNFDLKNPCSFVEINLNELIEFINI